MVMTLKQRREFFTRLKAHIPDPKTELKYKNNFQLLIAVLLSAQATDVSVNKASGPLFAAANTPEALYALGVDRVKNFIRTIGLFNTKAENVIKTCRLLIDEHDSKVPAERAALENLPGVESALASSTVSRLVLSGFNEGSLKWSTVSRNQRALDSTFSVMPEQLMNRDCSLSPVVVYCRTTNPRHWKWPSMPWRYSQPNTIANR